MSIDESEFKTFLSTIQSLNKQELENVLYSFPNKISKNGLTCQFFLIECTRDEIRESDFIKFIFSKIVVYVLQRKEYLLVGLTPEEQATRMVDIVKKAKSKFVKSPKSGEGGELILFLILESQGIIQLLNKMNLKTSAQMHYHGLDAIHIEVDNGIVLHYGQSKLYKDISQGISSAISDIKNFDEEKEEFEMNLVSSYIDDSRYDKYAEKIVDFLSPYSKKRDRLKTNSVFIGYDWDLLDDNRKSSEQTLFEYLKKEYEKNHDELYNKIEKSLKKNTGNNNRTSTFYILPFKNVDEFRTKFFQEFNK